MLRTHLFNQWVLLWVLQAGSVRDGITAPAGLPGNLLSGTPPRQLALSAHPSTLKLTANLDSGAQLHAACLLHLGSVPVCQ